MNKNVKGLIAGMVAGAVLTFIGMLPIIIYNYLGGWLGRCL